MVQYFGEFFCVILTTYPNMSPIPPKYQPPPQQQTPIFAQIVPPAYPSPPLPVSRHHISSYLPTHQLPYLTMFPRG